MLTQYIPVLLAFAFAALVAVSLIGLSALLGRGRLRARRTRETFEAGMPLLDSSRKRVSVKFFVVAMVFIVFDVEVAFLFPWAITLRQTGAFAFWSMIVFLGVLTVGFIYEWKKGALEWE